MTVLGRCLIFQPVLLACAYNNDAIINITGKNRHYRFPSKFTHTKSRSRDRGRQRQTEIEGDRDRQTDRDRGRQRQTDRQTEIEVNDLLQASDSGHVSILSLRDLSAAFDTIDHDILIKRLHTTFGCSGTVLDWFTSYLSFRTQSVLVGHTSTPSALKCGVPQGSVLGPLLFTLYTQSLSTVIC